MPTITDAQVEVAFDAYWAVVALEGDESRKAMRAALEAYERVRDVATIMRGAETRAEQGLKDMRDKVRKEYPL